jgi:hypothetical protein
MSETTYIPLSACKHGFLYRLNARNLIQGVFNENTNGFIGIREKFGDEYLFTEYHWDTGAPFGTVKPIELLEQVQDGIPVMDNLGSFDSVTNQKVAFDRPITDGGKGWYFVETGISSQDIQSVNRSNRELEDWLRSKMKQQ